MTLETEKRHPQSMNLDELSIAELTRLMNQQDATVPEAIKQVLPNIEAMIEAVVKRLKAGGRLFYIGAGTSGRLGVLDAAECIPTFGTSPELVQGVMAGSTKALVEAVEGAEDSEELAQEDLKKRQLTAKDIVIGIAASGRTPYVIGGLTYAKEMGAATGSIANNSSAKISDYADYPVEVETGAEILTGSTRLKAGTAQKLILNMVSTISMVKLGKAYQNLMVDVQASNEKLVDRSKRIIVEATGVSYDEAEKVFDEARSVKLAIVMILSGASKEQAARTLEEKEGFVREAIQALS